MWWPLFFVAILLSILGFQIYLGHSFTTFYFIIYHSIDVDI
jgi:hypothetical protein